MARERIVNPILMGGGATDAVSMSGRSVAEVIAGYTPRHVETEDWNEVADFVRGCITELAFPEDVSLNHLRHHLAALAHHAAWAHHHYPDLDRRTIFHHRVIDSYYTAWAGDVSDHTARARKRMLVSMGRRLNPKWDGAAQFAPTSEAVPNPYSREDLARVFDWIGSQGSDVRRQEMNVVVGLVLGAGLRSGEVETLRVRDVLVDGAGVLVHPSGYRGAASRQVPVLGEWEGVVRDRVAELDGDEYVFRPGRVSDESGVLSRYLRRPIKIDLPPPDTRRLRATWIVGHIMSGVPVDVIAAAAGLSDLRGYAQWVTRAGENRTELYRSMMRRRNAAAVHDAREVRRPALRVVTE